MKLAYRLTLPYPPALNAHWRVFKNRIIVAKESRVYKIYAQLKARALGVYPISGDCTVELHVFRPQKRGDLDGRLKVLFDCLNGILWKDDSQVVEIHAYRWDDKANPRVEIKAQEVET